MLRVWRQGVLWNGEAATGAHQVPTEKKMRFCPFVTLSSLPTARHGPVRNQFLGRGRRPGVPLLVPLPPLTAAARVVPGLTAPEPYSKARRPFVLVTRGPGEKSVGGLGFSGPLLSWELQINSGCGSSLGIVTRLALRVHTRFLPPFAGRSNTGLRSNLLLL